MHGLEPEQVEQILAMVDASGRLTAAEEHEDAFEEYAEILRTARTLPGFDLDQADHSRADVVDVSFFLGIGLTTLGAIAWRILGIAADLAAEEGLRSATAYLRRRFRRGEPASVAPVADRVVLELRLPEGTDPGAVLEIVLLQIAAIVPTEGAEEEGPAEAGPPEEVTSGGDGADGPRG